MKHLLRITLLSMLLLASYSVMAQNTASQAEKEQIAKQQRLIEELERQVAEDEKELNSIKKDKSSAQKRVQTITRQINARNQLLSRTEKNISKIEFDIKVKNERLGQMQASLENEKERYAEMVREAYRNHRQNNYVTYILASKSFSDAARRIANIRAVAELRVARMQRIDSLQKAIEGEISTLGTRREELGKEKAKAEKQRKELQANVSSAKRTMNQLTKKEKAALQEKIESEQRLDAAIAELRKLTKGNTEGASFSRKTSNLNLPVVNGSVRKYKGNMAEIVGPKGAAVRSIYDGKVVDVRRNRISGKYEVFVAHGEYITSYANLDGVSVEKNSKVAKNGTLGVIGSSVNINTMEPEYKMIFGIYSPSPKETVG